MQRISLGEHFSYRKLLKFTFPTILMMLFTSLYGVVDGLFVSNIVGGDGFVAINLIMPLIMILGAIGFMLGTGGSALVAKTLGEGDSKKAQEQFSMLIYVLIIAGLTVTALGMIFIKPIAEFLASASSELKEDTERMGRIVGYCTTYGRILFIAYTPYMLYNAFQSFLVVAEKTRMGFFISLAVGLTNMVLDALFIAVFKWGIAGAAAATGLSQFIGGIVPFIYFLRKNDTPLRIVKTKIVFKYILKSSTNGSSEMMSNVSMSLVNMLFNAQLLKYFGPTGVEAFGVIMYVSFIYIACFIGFSIGSSPIVSYHYGAKNTVELKNIRKKGFTIMMIGSVFLTAIAFALSTPLASIFSRGEAELTAFTSNALLIYSIHFIFCGVNIYGSAFFTALGNGGISALLSFVRTLVFQIAFIYIIPFWLGAKYIWLAVSFAELGALIMTVSFLIAKRKKYGY